jgi:predicted  nucleic acid-binding Zn-ribbon protein
MENSSNNQNILKVGIAVLIGALALLGYLYYGSKNENTELQKLLTGKVSELSTTKMKLDSISLSLDQKIAEVEALGGSITELQEMKAQLEKDKIRLKNDANFSVKNYQSKISEYEKFLTDKDSEIAKLKEENGILVTQNVTLQDEKQKVITENKGLYATKDSLNTKVSEVRNQNEDLRKKITIGSALKAVNVNVTAISSRGKERVGEVKNRKIDQLKVNFILPSNTLTAENNKDVYLRILDPQGAVLNDMSKGGVLTYANKEIGYSTKQNVLYTNNDQKVDMFYKKEMSFGSGTYNIELYSEGYKIGTGSFTVK